MRWLSLIIFYKGIMRPFLSLFVGVKWINAEGLKQSTPCIFVANHNSHLDTMALMAALPIRQLVRTHPVAAEDYFGNSKFKRLMSKWVINALLIKRDRRPDEPSPTDYMLSFIDRGHSVILFPEGSRGEPEKLQSFQKGIGVLLHRRPKVPFIPVFLSGLGRVLPKGETLMVPFDSYVIIGEACLTSFQDVPEIVDEVQKAVLSQRDQLNVVLNKKPTLNS